MYSTKERLILTECERKHKKLVLVLKHLRRINDQHLKMAKSYLLLITFLLLLAAPGGLAFRGWFHSILFGHGNNRQTAQPASQSASQFGNLISGGIPSIEVGSR